MVAVPRALVPLPAPPSATCTSRLPPEVTFQVPEIELVPKAPELVRRRTACGAGVAAPVTVTLLLMLVTEPVRLTWVATVLEVPTRRVVASRIWTSPRKARL